MLRRHFVGGGNVETSRVAATARGIGILAVVLFVGAPTAIQLGLVGPGPGFSFFAGSALLGLLAFFLGLIGIVRTRVGTGRDGRSRAVLGAMLGGAVVLVIFGLTVRSGDLPRINDITTNLDDPPAFVAVLELPENLDRDMAYPAEFREHQRRGYPDLGPIQVATPPAATLNRIADIAQELGWTVVARDDAAGTLEATETSRVFLFVDDVVVRVRASEGGSVVDVRSKSRVGRSDLGANAARIQRLADAL
jgi:uncharacterized protein (DUF1499 family)